MNEILDTYVGEESSTNGIGCALWFFIFTLFIILGTVGFIIFIVTK